MWEPTRGDNNINLVLTSANIVEDLSVGLRAGLADVRVEEIENVEDLWNGFKSTFINLQSRFIPVKNSRPTSVQPR